MTGIIGLDLTKVIEQVGKEKGINRNIIIGALESAMITAAKKKYGIQHEIEAKLSCLNLKQCQIL